MLLAAKIAALSAVGLVAGLGSVAGDESSSTPAAAARSASAAELSAALSANNLALRAAIDTWRAEGDPPTAPPPQEVMSSARYLQDTVRDLASRKNLARTTVELLDNPLAGEIRELVRAAVDLRRLSSGWPSHHVETGKPRPLAELEGYYDEAFRRFGVHRHYLAAIHLVESKFGRVKNDSVAGAQGPMQFIPSTWDIYGLGGDIHDPHDAILAAANMLDHNGAPTDYERALFAYNPSRLYVDAVKRYAKLIKRDPYAVYFLYCWGP